MPKTRKRVVNTKKETALTIQEEIRALPMQKKLMLARALLIKPNESSRTIDSYLNKEILKRWDQSIEMGNHNVREIFYFITKDIDKDPLFQQMNSFMQYHHLNFIDNRLIALIYIYKHMKDKQSVKVSSLKDLLKIFVENKLNEMSEDAKRDLSILLNIETATITKNAILDLLLTENMDFVLTTINNATAKQVLYNSKAYSSNSDFILKSMSSSSSSTDPLYVQLLEYPSKQENIELYEKVLQFLQSPVMPYERYKTTRNVISKLSGIKDNNLHDRFSKEVLLDILENRLRVKYFVCKLANVRTAMQEYEKSFTKLLTISSNEDDNSPWNKKGYITVLLDQYNGPHRDLIVSIHEGLIKIHNKNVEEILHTDDLYNAFIDLRNNMNTFLRIRWGDMSNEGNYKRSVLGIRKYLSIIQGIINNTCGLLMLLYIHLFGH